jgi:CHAD domain-containing protein
MDQPMSHPAARYAAAAGKPARAKLPRGATVDDAVRAALGVPLYHLLAYQAAAEDGEAEGIHQMRVALRRLRTALLLFGPMLEPHATERFNAELRRIGQILGTARDWDVFCLHTLPHAIIDLPEPEVLQPLRPAAEAARTEAHRAVETELAGPALPALIHGLSAWMEDGPELMQNGKLSKFAPALLDRIARKVARRGKGIRNATPEELHALRKSLKKLRYGIDDVAPRFRRKRVKAYLKGCKDLQKLLGTVNDAGVAVRLAHELSGGEQVDLAPAVSALAQWATARRDAALARLGRAWKAHKAAAPFWR